jgi:hypothetical protein
MIHDPHCMLSSKEAAYQLKGGVNSTSRPRRRIRLAATRLVGASSRRLRRLRRQAPAPAASSAKRAVPRPQILTRIAAIERSTRVLLLPCCACCRRRRHRRRCRRRRCRAHSAVHLLWPRCCQLPEPRKAAPQNKGQFHVISVRKWSAWMPHGQLGCHNNQYNQVVRCDLITCVLVRAARHDIPSRAARVVREKNDGLRSKIGRDGASKELANPSPRWLTCALPAPGLVWFMNGAFKSTNNAGAVDNSGLFVRAVVHGTSLTSTVSTAVVLCNSGLGVDVRGLWNEGDVQAGRWKPIDPATK